MKRMIDHMRGIQTIDQVNVLSVDGRRGWGASPEQVKYLTYSLRKDYEDVAELHNIMVARPVPNLDEFILGTELSLASPTVIIQ